MKDAQIARTCELRRDSTKPEKICWELLRNRSLSGVKFGRQHPIGPYFADFACISANSLLRSTASITLFKSSEIHAGRRSWNVRAGGSCASGQTMCSKALKVFGRQSAPLSQRPLT